MRILVVDDEKLLVKGVKFNLENEGYEVECAYDGASAVELARNGRFDLIILDVMMPELDGQEACMRIREFSNVPIIMLTAKGEDTDKIIGFECGADDYLTKPFNILELKARVRALLRRAGAAQHQRSGNELAAGHIILNTGEGAPPPFRRRRTEAVGRRSVHRPHSAGYRGAGSLEGGQDGGAHRQGVRPDGAADAQPWPGVQPGEPAERGLGI